MNIYTYFTRNLSGREKSFILQLSPEYKSIGSFFLPPSQKKKQQKKKNLKKKNKKKLTFWQHL